MSTKFQNAISKNELVKFAVGLDQYFISDPESGAHWVLQSWKQDIIPTLQNNSDPIVNSAVCSMMHELINDALIPVNDRLNFLLYHVYVHYYLLSEREIDRDVMSECEHDIINFLKDSHAQIDKRVNADVSGAIKRIQERGGLTSYSSN